MIALMCSCQSNQESKPQMKSEIPHSQATLEVIDDRFYELIDKEATIEVLAEGHVWTEGPLWVPELDALLYSDIPPNEIHIWKEGQGAQLYLKPSGYTSDIERGGEVGSNALLLNAENQLVLCQHGNRQMAKMDAPLTDPASNFETIANSYLGKKLNSPNDAIYHSNGSLYFTDPPYGLEKQMDDPTKEIDFQGVYRVDQKGEVSLVTKTLTRPNGLAFNQDETRLYVANSDPDRAIWNVYDVSPDGSVSNERVFFDVTDQVPHKKGLPDGMKVDARGMIYATGPGGVLIFTPEGSHLATINTGQATSNCAFGGKQMDYLYMTADDYLMRIKLKQSAK